MEKSFYKVLSMDDEYIERAIFEMKEVMVCLREGRLYLLPTILINKPFIMAFELPQLPMLTTHLNHISMRVLWKSTTENTTQVTLPN